MEKLKKKLEDIKGVLPLMIKLGVIDESAYKTLDEALDEALQEYGNITKEKAVADNYLSHDIYLFKVKDYSTLLLGRYNDGVFYVQRGDGVIYEYESYRVVWKQLLNCK
jgi:hypothetical protein